ncbi:MAG: CsbD family protein [Pirellulaceae bacterium]|jgi:uncharacterized protein YjbJ (UPF0337 family)|nr:CsbD family protein [Pirellulaceae bacterium]
MNWDQIQGKWTEMKGYAKEKWGDITDDEFDKVAGRREQLAGLVQQKYGLAKEEVEKQIRDFERSCHC